MSFLVEGVILIMLLIYILYPLSTLCSRAVQYKRVQHSTFSTKQYSIVRSEQHITTGAFGQFHGLNTGKPTAVL